MTERTFTASPLTVSTGHGADTADGAGTAAIGSPPADLPGYTLGEEIARGGMGIVYRGRDVALDREVAVKLLQPKFPAGGPSARRFVEEARITGQLQHPGIPPIHHVGTAPDGRPFLAMKLIKGRTLDALLKDRGNTNFVAVFESIAQAVGYAHAHGVIHRDLKPANVMVGAFGEVQVMDWGLAKLLANPDRKGGGGLDPDPDATLGTEIRSLRDSHDETHAGSVMGTPAFMPPEQAIGAIDQIDRRSDVFGLGALLCVVLTGRPPYVGETAESTRQLAARAKLDDAFAALDGCRAEPELVALCKRCLSVEKADRPADAGAVARLVHDLRTAADERARQAELNQARAEVQAAEQRKRRRVVQWAGRALVGVLLAGVVGTTIGLVQAREAKEAEARRADGEEKAKDAAVKAQEREAEERAKAVAAGVEADRQKAAAVSQKNEAEKQQKATAVASNFLKLVLKQGSADGQATRERAANPKLTMREALDFASKQIQGRFPDQPEIEADLRNTIGHAYFGLAAYAEAERHFKKALALYEKAVGPDHAYTLTCVSNLASVYLHTGDYAAAEPLYKRAVAAGCELGRESDDPDTLTSLNNLATLYIRMGNYAAAEPLCKRALAGSEKVLGPDHPDTLTSVDNLATLYRAKGDYAAAEPLCKRALAGFEKVHGPDHPSTLTCLNNLAVLYWFLKRLDRSVPLFEDAVKRRRAVLGDGHPDTLNAVANLGVNYRDAGRPKDAIPLLEEAYRAVGKHPQLGWVGDQLLAAYSTAGKKAEATALLRDQLTAVRKQLKPESAELGGQLAVVGKALLELGAFADAEPILRECVTLREKLAPKAWTTANAKSLLGGALLGQKKYADAEPLLLGGYDGMKTVADTIPAQGKTNLPDAAERLIRLYTALDKPDEVATWRTERARYPREMLPAPRKE